MGYPVDAGTEYREFECSNYTLLSGYIPEDGCGTPPIGCFLAITGSSHTDVTIRGEDDGTITVGTTGASGNTTWYLNGAFYASGASESRTVTGLTAGTYDISVIDENGCVVGANDILVLDGEFRSGDFVVTAPTVLTAVENPIIIRVGTAVNNPQPRQNTTTLTVAGTLADGFSLQFNLSSPYIYSQTFYAKAYPNKPNYFLASTLNNQYGTPVGTNTLTEICTSLADAINNDAVIPKVYYVNNSGTVVTLQARETGSKYILNSSNVIASTTGITITNTVIGSDYCDGQISDNYSIMCEVMANTDSTNQYPDLGQTTDYNKIAELVLPFNANNNTHKFDISGILKSQVNTPMPPMALSGSSLLPSVMQPYYCRISELYPLIPNTNTVKKRYKTETDVQWVINSSLDRYVANDMSAYLGNAYTNLNPNFVINKNSWVSLGTVTIENQLIDVTDTGTTAVQYSMWNYNNTTIAMPWQSSATFVAVSAGSYYIRISGMTEGRVFTFSRAFYLNVYGSGGDARVYPAINHDVEFLTNSPASKQIQRSSNEFLYFILPKNYYNALTMRGSLYFYDGSAEVGQSFFTISSGGVSAGGCMIMNLSYDKLGLAAYEVSGTTNRKIKRAELAVWQDDGINPIYQYTKTKIYKFEIDEMPKKFGILFQNSLGLYDAFDMIGTVDETITRDTDNYTVALDYNADGSIGSGTRSTATYNTKVTKKVVANTGWIDEAHFEWLMELLKSNNIYSTNTSNQNYLNLTDFSYKKSSLDNLFDCEFSFEWTIFESAISV